MNQNICATAQTSYDPDKEFVSVGEIEVSLAELKKLCIENASLSSDSFSSPIYRLTLSRFLFGRKNFINQTWCKLRKLAAIAGDIDLSKSKIIDKYSAEYLFLVCVYLRYRDLRFIPKADTTFKRQFSNWSKHELPHIRKISIYRPIGEIELIRQVNHVSPWFHDVESREISIAYGNLIELLKKSFYGYHPSPQFLSSIGFKRPTSRHYSFDDFLSIRNRLIDSRRNQKRTVNYILLEKL